MSQNLLSKLTQRISCLKAVITNAVIMYKKQKISYFSFGTKKNKSKLTQEIHKDTIHVYLITCTFHGFLMKDDCYHNR